MSERRDGHSKLVMRDGHLTTVDPNPPAEMTLAGLPPLLCSQGGIPYNEPHIEYWKFRALKAEEQFRVPPSSSRER